MYRGQSLGVKPALIGLGPKVLPISSALYRAFESSAQEADQAFPAA
jgi:hypothetical protein